MPSRSQGRWQASVSGLPRGHHVLTVLRDAELRSAVCQSECNGLEPLSRPAVGPNAGHKVRHTSVIPVRYRVAARSDEPSSVVRQVQSMGEYMAKGRIDLTGHVILIVEEQPIVALNMQIAAEEAGDCTNSWSQPQ